MVIPLMYMNTNAPVRASGTVNMITNGSLKLSNWAARIRNIRIIASTKAQHEA